jgi:ComF family protein
MFLANIFREVFFPRRCLGCGTREVTTALCNACFAHTPLHGTLFCGLCRARLPLGIKICHLDHPYVLGAAGDYQNPMLRALIHAVKFKRNREAALPLGLLLLKYTEPLPLDTAGFSIVALPLSKRRERERGFNQSKLIANIFSKRAGLRVADGILVRARHTTPQSQTAGARERQENVRGAFAVPKNISVPKNIFLIDDVVTSGATLFEAARVLKSAGARTIIALTAAKA